jgi:hypothetical protein
MRLERRAIRRKEKSNKRKKTQDVSSSGKEWYAVCGLKKKCGDARSNRGPPD